MSGRRDMNDPRNKLYLEVVDIVKTLNPEFIFLENVKGLISMDGGKVKKRILEDFKNIGYEIQAHILNAADFETPQKRERVVFIGFLNDIDFEFPEESKNHLTLKNRIY